MSVTTFPIKPLLGTQPVWRHDLAADLRSVIVANEGSGYPYDLLQRVSFSDFTDRLPTWRHSSDGAGVSLSRASGANTTRCNFTSGNWTVMVRFLLTGFTSGEQQFAFGRLAYVDETNNQGWALGGNTVGSFRFVVSNNNSSASYNLNSTTARSNGIWTLAGRTNGVNRQLFVNGKQEATTTNNPASASCAGTMILGPNNTFTERHFVILALAWARWLTDDELYSLHVDPWAMFRRRKPVRFGGATGNPWYYRASQGAAA